MRTSSEYLQQAKDYDVLAAQARSLRRKTEYVLLAGVYRYLAEEAALLCTAAAERPARDIADRPPAAGSSMPDPG